MFCIYNVAHVDNQQELGHNSLDPPSGGVSGPNRMKPWATRSDHQADSAVSSYFHKGHPKLLPQSSYHVFVIPVSVLARGKASLISFHPLSSRKNNITSITNNEFPLFTMTPRLFVFYPFNKNLSLWHWSTIPVYKTVCHLWKHDPRILH